MTKDQTVNIDETTSANKIKLVVTDAVAAESELSPAETRAVSTPTAETRAVSTRAVSTAAAETRAVSTPVPEAKTAATAGLHPAIEKSAHSSVENSADPEAALQPTPANEPLKALAADISTSSALDDPDRVMHELPVDEFFKVLERSTPEQLQNLIHTFEKGARTKSGTKVLQKVIEVQKEPRSLLSILMWWELRRPLYNIAVGLAGLPAAFALVVLFGYSIPVVFINALGYMFLANVCYSLGTPAEVIARTFYKDKAETYGPVLLTLGTIFSVLLTFMIEFAVLAFIALGIFRL